MEIKRIFVWFYSIFYTVVAWPWNFIWWSLKTVIGLALYVTALTPVVILRWCSPELGARLRITRFLSPKIIQTPYIEELLNTKYKLVCNLEYIAKEFNDEKVRTQTTLKSGFDDQNTLGKRLRSAHLELQEAKKKYKDQLKSIHSTNQKLEKEILSLKTEIGRFEEEKRKGVVSETPKEELLTFDDQNTLEKQLRSAHLTLQEAKKTYEDRLRSMHSTNEKLEQEILSLKTEIERYEEEKRKGVVSETPNEELLALQNEIQQKDELLAQKDTEIDELENELDITRQHKEELEGHLQGFENEVKGFNFEIRAAEEKLRIEVLKYEKSENENKDLRQSLQDTEKELDCNKLQLRNIESEKDDALKRLSEIMSLRLRDSNPNIVDLNDHYRPTKLAEMINELYDNQWTDVFSYLEDNWDGEREFSDESCIQFLLNILMETYVYCQEKVTADWNEGISKILWTVNTDDDKELLKKLKDVRRKNALFPLPTINKEILHRLSYIELSEDDEYSLDFTKNEIKHYVEECARVCWLMALQDPPVCLICDGWERGENRRTRNSKDNPNIDNHTRASGNENNQAEDQPEEPTIVASGCISDSQKDASAGNSNFVEQNEQSVCLNDRTKIAFDKDLYKEYTRRGQFIEYIVWPVMYLHKDGPLLNKGVAQGCN